MFTDEDLVKHCTIAQARNWGNQGLQKMPKSKPLLLFLIQFWSNLFWMVENYPNFVRNIFLCQKNQILGVFFSFVGEASWRAGQTTMKFAPCMLYVIYKKHKNCLGSPSLWILHLKYENICHLSFYRCWDIWRSCNWIFNDHSNRPQQFSD